MSSPPSIKADHHQTSDSSSSSKLPIKEIPGEYGIPFFGSVRDRLDFYYNQGPQEFFKTRMDKYQSTIFRTNMPPGPFIASNPKVIVLLDAVSFPVLFDTSKIEKKNVLDGTFMPSLSLFGGYRMCAFLDPSEPNHAKLKQLFLSLLTSLHKNFLPLFKNSLNDLFNNLESQMTEKSKADFNTLSDNMSFNFVFRLFFNKNIQDTKLGSKGQSIITKWLFFQLAPLITLGLPKILNCLEDFLLHTFPLPSFFVKSDYNKVYKVVYESSTSILDEAEQMGIKRDEACHNLIFLVWFNAYGGMKALFPALIKWIGLAGPKLHKQLVEEIRAIVSSEGGLTLNCLEKMTLTKSVVYEVLRMEPPIPYQYGKAKDDMVIQNHDTAFEVKKGETIFGFQPFATKDSNIFENPEEFIGDRFIGDDGKKLLNYVYWSNGRETEDPTMDNKQCPAKDLVVLMSRLMVAEFFIRYDTFTVDVANRFLGSFVTLKSLTKATRT